jgi:hypothetical protein
MMSFFGGAIAEARRNASFKAWLLECCAKEEILSLNPLVGMSGLGINER